MTPLRNAPQSLNPTGRRLWALVYGGLCHGLFAVAALFMISVMWSGMQTSFGTLPAPASWIMNLLLLAQFPIGHSFFLSHRGRGLLKRLAPGAVSSDMAPTTYVIIASVQVLLLFSAWSPSGIILWQATGELLFAWSLLYGLAWLLLGISTLNAGIGLQSGYNGWSAVFVGRRVVYPDMPTRGLFRISRQPIYVSFALTTWTVPVWTPDQVLLAAVLTGYCLIGPLFKEARFRKLYAARFEKYASNVPYWLPLWRRGRSQLR